MFRGINCSTDRLQITYLYARLEFFLFLVLLYFEFPPFCRVTDRRRLAGIQRFLGFRNNLIRLQDRQEGSIICLPCHWYFWDIVYTSTYQDTLNMLEAVFPVNNPSTVLYLRSHERYEEVHEILGSNVLQYFIGAKERQLCDSGSKC